MKCSSYYHFLLLFGLLTAVVSCRDAHLPYAAYYFPQGHYTYIYQLNDTLQQETWQIDGSGAGWHIEVRDELGIVTQTSDEQRLENGVTLDRLILQPTTDSISVEVVSNQLFSYAAMDSLDVLVYHIQWQDHDSLQTTYSVIRNRRYMGMTTCEVKGTASTCLKYHLSERIISDQDGQLTLTSEGYELYAEGVGLCRRYRSLSHGLELDLRLVGMR